MWIKKKQTNSVTIICKAYKIDTGKHKKWQAI